MFEAFPKLARLNRECVITEKIDGTNAHVFISDDIGDAESSFALWHKDGLTLFAGSRTRFVTPTNDNHGFAKFAQANAEALIAALGPGRHYGEWYGQGIQRGYGLKEKRFALFNTTRWKDVALPLGVEVVPEVYRGLFTTEDVKWALEDLRTNGSMIAPGFMNPEGIVVYHTAANTMFKVTLKDDEKPKGLVGK